MKNKVCKQTQPMTHPRINFTKLTIAKSKGIVFKKNIIKVSQHNLVIKPIDLFFVLHTQDNVCTNLNDLRVH